ncbi:MAG: metallophosphoesterase [Clostridia bacterium]|nr:metallophosphoesterase [Clostridia bacterium]
MSRKNKGFIFAPVKKTHRVRNFFLSLLIALLLIVGMAATINYVLNHSVSYQSLTVTVNNLPADLESFTIMHISDLRGQRFGENQSGIVSAIGSRNYSCIVFTGDMLGDDGDPAPFLELVDALPKDITKMMIAGDNDLPTTNPAAHGTISPMADWVLEAQQHGVILLDEPYRMTRGKKHIWFVPEFLYSLDLDSMEQAYRGQADSLNALESLSPDQAALRRVVNYELERIEHIRLAMEEMTEADVQIAVTHTPLAQDYTTTMIQWQDKSQLLSMRRVGLVLAGHYCAGTWRLPGIGALYVPEIGWFPKDAQIMGLQYLGGLPQHISPGLGAGSGTDWQPFRLFNQPAVTMIKLTSKI